MKIESLQMGRALAALYVVLFHASEIMRGRLGITIENSFIQAGNSGVEFFFVLSGFIMFMMHSQDIGHPDRAASFAWKRFIRIYPLFWVVFGILVMGQIVMGQVEPDLQAPTSILRAVLLLPFEQFPPLTVAWTLSHELLFYSILGLCILSRHLGLLLLAFWLIACLAAAIAAPNGLNGMPQSFLFSTYNLLFVFGMVAAWGWRKLPSAWAPAVLITALILMTITILYHTDIPESVKILAYGVTFTAMIIGLVNLEDGGAFTVPKWLSFIGDASYSIYLLHSISMAVVAMVFLKLGISMPPMVMLVVLFCIGLVSGIVLHLGVERPLLKAMRRGHHAASKKKPLTNL